jgi:hypothetical protein
VRLPDAEPAQRWHLFVNPRSLKGLNILCQRYCNSDLFYLLFHLIGSGSLTVLRQPDIELAKLVAQEAIERQQHLSLATLRGDTQAMKEQRQIPKDLEQQRISISMEHTVRLLLIDMAARLGAVPNQNYRTSSISALLRAIGAGEMTLLNVVNPEIRIKYLRNTQAVKEYICLQKEMELRDFHRSRQTSQS